MELYHYTRTDTAIKKILPWMKLKMNSLGKMNDPKENLDHIVNYDDFVGFTNKSREFNLDESFIAEKIRTEAKIIAFSIDKEILSEEYRVASEGFQFQRMWATYGQNHEGICIVIDSNGFKRENKKVIEKYGIIDGKVSYDNFQYQGIPVPLYGMSPENSLIHKHKSISQFWTDLQKNSKFVKDRFYTKNMDWEGESEYRFLTFSSDNDDIFLSFKNSLIKVILGINFSKYLLPSVKELVPKEKLFVITLSDSGNFELNNYPQQE
jgi:hypothetical protein